MLEDYGEEGQFDGGIGSPKDPQVMLPAQQKYGQG